MKEEVTRWLMFSYWGLYLKKDYMEVGLNITEILMKHWGQVEWLRGVAFSYDEGLEDVDSIDAIKKEVLNNRKHYNLYDVTFFIPSVTEEIYVNRLYVNKEMLTVEEYDDLKYFRTNNSLLNEQRTQELLKVFTEVGSLPPIQDLWMVNYDRNAFMGYPAYLYRPSALYDRVEDVLEMMKTRDEEVRLVGEFTSHVPTEWVIDYLRGRLGADKVQEMAGGKIRVLFFDRELTNIKVNTREFLRTFEKDVDEYCRAKGVTLYKGEGEVFE